MINTSKQTQFLVDDEGNVEKAAQFLVGGGLVAFPTETVYGLGAHALDANAVTEIFKLKGRPSTDPLIVHVLNSEAAKNLSLLDSVQSVLFEALAHAFWPGPLTLVVPAASCVPSVVRAGGEFVGLRAPAHSTARKLLAKAGVPIAAPSANLFGHVSPTLAAHVYDDFPNASLIIIDGGECSRGIESTVLRLEHGGNIVTVLRPGSVTPLDIKNLFKSKNINSEIAILKRYEKSTEAIQAAPGQLLTHYAPQQPCYLSTSTTLLTGHLNWNLCDLKNVFIVDFQKKALSWKPHVGYYCDLSEDGNGEVAQNKLFAILRDCEKNRDCEIILLPDLSENRDEVIAALFDRIYRAASGKFI